MNKWVTDNAMQLLHGQDICSPLIHSILSNSLQTIKVVSGKKNGMVNQLIHIRKNMVSFYGSIK